MLTLVPRFRVILFLFNSLDTVACEISKPNVRATNSITSFWKHPGLASIKSTTRFSCSIVRRCLSSLNFSILPCIPCLLHLQIVQHDTFRDLALSPTVILFLKCSKASCLTVRLAFIVDKGQRLRHICLNLESGQSCFLVYICCLRSRALCCWPSAAAAAGWPSEIYPWIVTFFIKGIQDRKLHFRDSALFNRQMRKLGKPERRDGPCSPSPSSEQDGIIKPVDCSSPPLKVITELTFANERRRSVGRLLLGTLFPRLTTLGSHRLSLSL